MKRYLTIFLIPLISLALLVATFPAKEILAGHGAGSVIKSLAVEKGYELLGSGIGGGVGLLGGVAVGASCGALAGSFLLPGVGTLGGAIIGGALGGIGGLAFGSFLGGFLGRAFHRKKLLKKIDKGEGAQFEILSNKFSI